MKRCVISKKEIQSTYIPYIMSTKSRNNGQWIVDMFELLNIDKLHNCTCDVADGQRSKENDVTIIKNISIQKLLIYISVNIKVKV